MSEPTQITFSYKEIAEALVKQNGIHQGIWGLYVKFGIKAANIGENEDALRPAAIIPILDIGLQKFDKVNSLSVDAAKVNPKGKQK